MKIKTEPSQTKNMVHVSLTIDKNNVALFNTLKKVFGGPLVKAQKVENENSNCYLFDSDKQYLGYLIQHIANHYPANEVEYDITVKNMKPFHIM